MHDLLDAGSAGDWCLPVGTDLGAALTEVDGLLARVQSLRLAVLSAAERHRVCEGSAHTDSGAWAATVTLQEPAAASRDVTLASRLGGDLHETRQALAAGELSTDHARVIASSTAQLPGTLTTEQRTTIERALVEEARHSDPRRLRVIARRALGAVSATPDEVAAHEDGLLRSEEEAARAATRLTMHDNGDGTTSGHFTVPTLAASVLRKAVQQLSSPRRQRARTRQRAASSQGAASSQPASSTGGSSDWAHENGLSLVELLEHLPTERLAGKVAATVVVTLDLATLREGVGAAHLDTGQDISAAEARRLACNAGLVPVVLDGASLPLDLGRAERLFTEAQRVALATTYDSCAAFGCNRPYAWCELHHEDPWHRGGSTDLALAVPLCGHHHRRTHDPAYHHRVVTDPRTAAKTVAFVQRP